MNKKILLAGIFIAITLAGAVFWFFGRSCDISKIDTSGMILFYGTGCPHCANVDEYIKNNNVKEKVQFAKKEAFYNKCNAKLLESLVGKCNLSIDNIGVPFLWDGANFICASGDVDVINIIKAKIEE